MDDYAIYAIWGATVAAYVLVPAGIFYLGLRFVRAHERRGSVSAAMESLDKRILELESRLEGVAESVEQIADGQRFTTDVLTSRASVERRD